MTERRTFGRWQADDEPPRRGGNAIVFKVYDTINQELGPHALKLLDRVERVDRFEQEIKALQIITSSAGAPPEIIKIVDWQLGPNENYLVTRWIAGGDADKAFIRTKQFVGRLGPAISAMIPVVRAIDFLHKQALAPQGYIAHRDLKPANLLVDEDGRLIVTDFGCALFDERLTGSAGRVGSLGYTAPELVSGRFEGDHRPADVYSLGCVLWALLSGEAPPGKDDLGDPGFNLSLRHPDYEFKHIQGLILACVSKGQAGRPTAAELLQEMTLLRDRASSMTPSTISASLESRLRAIAAHPEVQQQRNVETRRQEAQSRLIRLLDKQVRRWLRDTGALTALTSNGVYKVIAEEPTPLDPGSLSQHGLRLLLGSFDSPRRPELDLPSSKALVGAACRLLVRPGDPEMADRIASIVAYLAVFELADSPSYCVIAELVTGVGQLAADLAPIRVIARAGEERLLRRVEEARAKIVLEVEKSIDWGLAHHEDDRIIPIADPVLLPDPPFLRPLALAASIRAPADRGPQFIRPGKLLGVASDGTIAVESNVDLTLFRFGGTEERIFVTEQARGLRLEPCGVLVATSSIGGFGARGASQRSCGRVLELDPETRVWSVPYYSGTRGVSGACYSRDGSTLAVVHQTPGVETVSELLLIDRATGSARVLCTLRSTSIERPAWCQARDCIVASLKTAASDSLAAISLANGDVTSLVSGSYDFVSVSPAGDRLAVLGPETRSQHRSLCIVDLNGGGIARLTFDACSAPSWTPDGQAVVWTERDPSSAGLVVRGARV